MTVAGVYDALALGGGRIEFCLTFPGVPYGACTSSDLAEAINSDTFTQRILFGDNDYAEDCVLFPVLRPPGSQTTTWDPTKGLNIGPMQLSMDMTDLGTSYAGFIKATQVPGFPGISNVYSTGEDSSIAWGRIAQGFDDEGTGSIDIFDESGTLEDYIDNNATSSNPVFLWIGTECMAVENVTTSATDPDAFRLQSVTRGVFRSKAHGHYTDDNTKASTVIATAPVGGMANRFAHVWAFSVDEQASDGYSPPVMIHSGRVSESISVQPGIANFTVHGWLDSIDIPIRPDPVAGRLSGYVLSRATEKTSVSASRTGDAAAHIIIIERTGGTTGSFVRRNIWLCEQGETVYYKSLEDLTEAIDTELRRVSAGATVSERSNQTSGDGTTDNPEITCANNYWVGDLGIYTDLSSLFGTEVNVRIGGQLPLILNMLQDAFSNFDPKQFAEQQLVGSHGWCMNAGYITSIGDNYQQWLAPPWKDSDVGTMTSCLGGRAGDYKSLAARYIYQYYTTEDTNAVGSDGNTRHLINRFPWPSWDGADHRIFFQPGFDTGTLTLNQNFTLGTKGQKPLFEVERYIYDHFAVGIADNNGTTSDGVPYIDLSDTITFKGYGTTYPAVRTFSGNSGPFRQHYQLAWCPIVWEDDPWLIRQGYDTQSDSISKIFLGVMGDDANGEWIPNSKRIDFVPDSFDGGDFVATIDWDSLEDIIDTLHPSETYWLLGGEDLGSVKEALFNELLLHGVTPYYELDQTTTPQMMRIKFRRISSVSASTASSSGRTIDSSTLLKDSNATTTHVNHWRYSDINAKINSTGDGKYGAEIKVDSIEARQAIGGRKATLTIKAPLTNIIGAEQIEQDRQMREQVLTRIGDDILLAVSNPRPEVRVECTIQAALKLAPGAECLFTDSSARNPYDGSYGMSQVPGIVTEVSNNWSTGVSRVKLQIVSDSSEFGLAPSFILQPGEARLLTSGSSGSFLVNPSVFATLFSGNGRLDLSFFDCITWNPSSNTYAQDTSCGCGDYAVVAIEDDDETAIPEAGTIGTVDTNSNSATISSIDTTSFDWSPQFLNLSSVSRDTASGTRNIGMLLSQSSRLQFYYSPTSNKGYVTKTGEGVVLGYPSGPSTGPSGLKRNRLNAAGSNADGTLIVALIQNQDCAIIEDDFGNEYYTAEVWGSFDGGDSWGKLAGQPEEFDEDVLYNWGTTNSHVVCDGSTWYASGDYTSPTTIYRNGTSTSHRIGTFPPGVDQLIIYDSKLHVYDANGNLYSYNGTVFVSHGHAYGTPGSNNDTREGSSAVHSGELWTGFNTGRVFSWDGSSWTDRGTPLSNQLPFAMYSDGTDVWCATSSGGTITIWQWDTGTTWTSIATKSTSTTGAEASVINNGVYGVSGFALGDQVDSNSYNIQLFTPVANTNPIAVVTGDYDDTNLQECQKKYTFFADNDNGVEDFGGTRSPGRRLK